VGLPGQLTEIFPRRQRLYARRELEDGDLLRAAVQSNVLIQTLAESQNFPP
jgi:hypothetical protein